MITNTDISEVVFFANQCCARLANKFVNQANYGMEEQEGTMDTIKALKCYIKALKDYIPVTNKDFIENGEMSLGKDKIVLSKKNSLSLESKDKKISVSPGDINCISEEDIYTITNKIKALCCDC